MMDAAIALMPAIGADSDIPPLEIVEQLKHVGDLSQLIENDRAAYVEPALRALGSSMKNQSLLLTLRGMFLIVSAEDLFNEKASDETAVKILYESHLGHARTFLENAWTTDHANSAAAAARILVAKDLREPTDVMERWFARALAADPDDLSAYQNKLDYLLSQGEGGVDAVIAFGRECVRTKRWNTDIPFLLLDAYSMIPPGGLTDQRLANPLVWADIQTVFEGYIGAHQRSKHWRSRYALLAASGGHWADADFQFKQMASGFSLKWFTQEDYNSLKKKVAAKAAEEQAAARAADHQ